MQKKNKKLKKQNYNTQSTKANSTKTNNTTIPKPQLAPWFIATIIIFLIVGAAYQKYISSIISQILLVVTVISFSVYQRYLKNKAK